MSSFDFLFAHLGAFFCGVSTGAKRLMLSIGVLLGGAAAHAALSKDTMVRAENSAAARREGRRASASVEGVNTRKLQVALLKKIGRAHV